MAGDAADEHGRDREDEPAEERPLPVLGTPAAGTAGEIQRVHRSQPAAAVRYP